MKISNKYRGEVKARATRTVKKGVGSDWQNNNFAPASHFFQGHPKTIFGKYLFGRRFEI